MNTRSPKEYSLNVYSDLPTVKDVIKAILHTIFFHRFFPNVRPYTFDVLDLTISAAGDVELRTLVEARVNSVAQHYLSIASETPRPSASSAARTASGGAGAGTGGGGVRGQIAVEFLERRRKRTGGVGVWFPGFTGNGQGEGREEEVCWERWVLDVTVATPRTEGERLKVRQAMNRSLHKATMDIITYVNRDKDHIPSIVNESNPFPYQIILNPQPANWSNRLGLY